MSTSAPEPFRGSRPLRVLIVRTGAMGDVLHAMPAVAALRALHPEWKIGWAIEPRWLPLLSTTGEDCAAMPLVDRVHTVPTGEWNRRPVSFETLGEVLKLRREMRAERYDVCVDMQGLMRSAVVGRLARATDFVGSATPRERPAGWLYGRRIRLEAVHVIDRGCELLGGALGETLRAAAVALPVNEADECWRDTLLRRLVPEGARVALLAPTAGWGAKQWPVERYGALAAALAESRVVPLVNSPRAHDPVAAAVAKASGGCAVPVVCGMAQLVALLRRVDVMVAGDTGPLHLAAALGRPVVGLYGPTDPRRTGPYAGPYACRSAVVRHASSKVDHRRHWEPEAGLMQIGVDEVVEAVAGLLKVQQVSEPAS